MAGCAITSGIGINCETLRKIGGVNKLAYVFNITDLEDSKYNNTNEYVSAINFDTYKGLYSITSKKKSHSGGYTLVKQDPGGNVYFQHDVILKMFPEDPDEDLTIENMVVGEVGIILETNNQEFILYGAQNGMEVTEATQNTGQEPASDVADTLTFQGEEKAKPLRISVGGTGADYAATKAYLESLVV